MDEPILRYKNTVLRRSDLRILKTHRFLNDTLIEFYFAHLSTLHPSNEILFIPPAISFFIANAPDYESLKSTVEPLKLHEKEVIFFTVNNNTDFTSSDGGSHWSLLVFCRRWNVFMHYDSHRNMNKLCALSLFKSVGEFVCCGGEFVECSTPQQRNGYDCGLYVMEIARVLICKWYMARPLRDCEEKWFDDIGSCVNRKYVEYQMRSQLVRLVMELKGELIPMSDFSYSLGFCYFLIYTASLFLICLAHLLKESS